MTLLRAFLQPLHDGAGDAFLIGVVHEDGRHVLTFPGRLSSIVSREERLHERFIGDFRWIEIYLHGLGVVSELVVGGVLGRSPCVSHPGADDS